MNITASEIEHSQARRRSRARAQEPVKIHSHLIRSSRSLGSLDSSTWQARVGYTFLGASSRVVQPPRSRITGKRDAGRTIPSHGGCSCFEKVLLLLIHSRPSNSSSLQTTRKPSENARLLSSRSVRGSDLGSWTSRRLPYLE